MRGGVGGQTRRRRPAVPSVGPRPMIGRQPSWRRCPIRSRQPRPRSTGREPNQRHLRQPRPRVRPRPRTTSRRRGREFCTVSAAGVCAGGWPPPPQYSSFSRCSPSEWPICSLMFPSPVTSEPVRFRRSWPATVPRSRKSFHPRAIGSTSISLRCRCRCVTP